MDATPAAPVGMAEVLWTSRAFPFQQPGATSIRLPTFLETSESPASLSPATMSNSSSCSHAQWQGTARWKDGWNEAWKGRDESTMTEDDCPAHDAGPLAEKNCRL